MLPVLLRIGPVTIYSFGFFLFLGFFLACFVVWKQARTGGLSEEKVLDALFLTVFLALVAGRLGYVFANGAVFAQDFSRIVLFFKYPGISLPGLLLAAVVLSALAAKNSGLEVLWVWDVFGLAAAFLAVFGSVGCFLDGCFPEAVYLPLVLAFLAVLLVAVSVLVMKKFSSVADLSEIARRRGMFFLCYLIFQLLSLLMTTWFTRNWWREGLYLVGLTAVIAIFLVRYRLFFKYVYSAVSQRRSHAS